MKTTEASARQQRQLKFAEAGILFVLVLGMTIFLGVKIASNSDDPAEVPVATVSEKPAITLTEAAVEALPTHPNEVAGELEQAPAESLPLVVTYAEAELAYHEGDFDGATNLFEAYCINHPDNAWGHYMLGLAAWKAGDAEEAELALKTALAIKPDHLKSMVNLGRVLLDLERPQEALAQIEAAAAIDPASVAVKRVLSRTYHNLGLLDQAVAGYRATLTIDENDLWSLNNMGLVLIQQERFAEALPPLARAAQIDSLDSSIQNNLGIALERTGHHQAAAAAYTRALAGDQDHDRASISLARVSDLAATMPGEPVDLAALAADFNATVAMTFAAATVVETEEENAQPLHESAQLETE